MEKMIFKTNTQKVLNFLIDEPNKEFTRDVIEKKIHISKAGVNMALRELTWNKLVNKTVKGKAFLYEADFFNPIVRQLKVLKIIIFIYPIIQKIKPFAQKIIVFGSASRGESRKNSDIDLFILTRNKSQIKLSINNSKYKKIIQPIFKTAIEFSALKEQDIYFYQEIDRGIVLFEDYE